MLHSEKPRAAHRLGIGEVTTDWDVAAHNQILYLRALGRLHAEAELELQRMLPQLPRFLATSLSCRNWRPLWDWCDRWQLTSKGRPAEWAMRRSCETLRDMLLFHCEFRWDESAGGSTPNRPSLPNPRIEDFRGLHVQTLASFPRKVRADVGRQVEAYKKLGWRKTPLKRDPIHFEWAVRRIVDEWAYKTIAQAYPPHHPDNIKTEVKQIRRGLELQGVSGKRGLAL